MPYVRRASIHNAGRHRVTVRTKNPEGDLSGGERGRVEQMVLKARRILPGIHAAVIGHASGANLSPRVRWAADTFFLRPTNPQLLFVAGVLVLINNGLYLRHRLKVHTIPTKQVEENGDENWAVNADGYVRGRPNAKDGTGRGSINIQRTLFAGGQDDIALVTYIHEASHKYADTLDVLGGLWNEDTEVAGYKPEKDVKGTGNVVAMTDAGQAIVNADSYGWFCMSLADVMRL